MLSPANTIKYFNQYLRMKRSLALVLTLALLGSAYSASLTKCQVYNYVKAVFPQSEWGRFTCIAYYESTWNPQAINTQTWDYGLFQLSSIWWCNDGQHQNQGNGCGTNCQTLLNDVSANVRCAHTVYASSGAEAWVAYTQHRSECDNYNVADCASSTSSTSSTPATSSSSSPSNCGTYTIASGDSLSGIAAKYGNRFTWQTLCSFNHLSNCDAISIGQVLNIPC